MLDAMIMVAGLIMELGRFIYVLTITLIPKSSTSQSSSVVGRLQVFHAGVWAIHISFIKTTRIFWKSLYHSKVHLNWLNYSFSVLDDFGNYIAKQVVWYQFTSEEHALPKVTHDNSSGSTPYKSQPRSTRDLLKEHVENSKPQKACRQVKNELSGIESIQSAMKYTTSSKDVTESIPKQST